MSVGTLAASFISVLLALTTAALVVIRKFWPVRSSVEVGRLSWVEDGDVPLGRTVSSPGARVGVSVRAVRWQRVGMAAGAVGAVFAMATGESAWGAMVAWPVFGLGVLAGTFAGELGVPAPSGPVRRAELRVRRLLDYIPRSLGALVCVATPALFALATVTTAVGVLGDRNATESGIACVAGSQPYASGPWPGSGYTVPTLCAVVLGLVLAGFVLRRVVRRPRLTDVVQVDDISRRRSAEVVTAAAGVFVLTPAVMAIWSHSLCGEPLWAFTGPALSGLEIAAFLAMAWCGGFLLSPSTRSTGRRAA